MYIFSYGVCYGRRERIAHLPICGSFLAHKLPVIWKSLQQRCHFNSQPWHPVKILRRCFIGESHTVYTKCGPSTFCSGRAQIWSTMFLRTAHNGRSNSTCFLFPLLCLRPATLSHQGCQRGPGRTPANHKYICLGCCQNIKGKPISSGKLVRKGKLSYIAPHL